MLLLFAWMEAKIQGVKSRMIYVLHDTSAVESSRLRRVRCSVVLLSFPSCRKWCNAGQTRSSSLPLIPPTPPLTTPSSTLLANATTSLGQVAATCPSVTRSIQQTTSFLRCPLVVVTDCARWFGPPAPPNATLSTASRRSMSRAPSDFYRTPFVQVPSSYLCYLLAFLPSSTLLAYSSGGHCRSAVSC